MAGIATPKRIITPKDTAMKKTFVHHFASKSLPFTPLLLGLAAGGTASSQADLVVNPSPDTVYITHNINGHYDYYTLDLHNGNSFSLSMQSGKNGGYLGSLTLSPGPSSPGNTLLTDNQPITNGTLIDSSFTFNNISPYLQGDSGSNLYGFTMTMASGPTPLYGWVSIDTAGSGNSTYPEAIMEQAKVNWAYDNSGQPVIAGAVPEPSSVALLATAALLAGSTKVWNRRRAKLAA